MTAFLPFLHVFSFIFVKITTKTQKGPKIVPKKSQFSRKVPNFALVKLFRGRSQIPNPVLERLPDPLPTLLTFEAGPDGMDISGPTVE